MKNTQSKTKLIKAGKKIGTYCLECKDYTDNFKPQEIKMTNNVLREKSNFVDPVSEDFEDKNTTTKHVAFIVKNVKNTQVIRFKKKK